MNMENQNISAVQKTVLQLLAHNLFSVPFSPDPDTDWRAVLKESRAQAVNVIAFQNYAELPLDEELSGDIKKMIRANTMNNIKCFQYHAYLHRLMTENKVSYCIVKGASSAHYYPDPLLRNMGDVDFFVPQKDIARAMALLEENGFEKQPSNHRIHVVFHKGKGHYEMHFKPVALPDGATGKIFMEYWKPICEDSVLIRDGLTECRVPDPFLHGFILLSHLQHHLLVEGIGLRHVCDWAVFVNSFSSEEFISLFEKRLKRVGLWRLAQLISLIGTEYLGVTHREWMGDDREIATALLTDILAGGNFGRKDRQRAQEGFFISDHGKDGVKTNRIVQAFKSLNHIVDSHWKVAKKFPLLYPFGWAYFSIRYLIRVLLGKRKLNLVDTYVKSGERKELYKKLNLFEPEE